MKIYFIKTNSYDLKKDKADRYAYLCRVGLQDIDPLPLSPYSLIIPTKHIIHSTLKRVSMSLKYKPKQIFISSDLLREVLFDINKMCTKDEFEKLGSFIVRKKFNELFVSDKLPQKRSVLFNQIKLIINQLKTIPDEEVTIISHSFKLKLFEAYLKTNGKIETNPELIMDYIKPEERTFKFNEGFEFMV